MLFSYKNIDTQSEIYSEAFSAWEMLYISAASPTLIMILKTCLLPPWFSFLQGMRKISLQRGIHGGTPSLPGRQGEVLRLADCPVSSVLSRAGREPWPGTEPEDVHLHWKAESVAGSSITTSFFYNHLFLTFVNLRLLKNSLIQSYIPTITQGQSKF